MNKSAFENYVRSWRMKAVKVCRSCGADSEEAEDIAQEVMLRLWQMHDVLEKYQSIEAIVTIAARHLLRDHQRRRTTETLNDATLISISNSPQETLEMIEEIARLLGIEKTSVSTLLARARRTLLEEIKQRNKQ